MARPANQEVEQKILDSALQLVLTQGLVGLRVRDVARHADTNVAMIYRRFVDRDGLLHAVIAHFYKERIKGLIAKAESLAAQEPPATVEDLIAAIPPPDYPGSAEVHGLMSRVPALASENESFRLDIQNFIEEHFPRMRSAVRKIISRFPVEYQFDDRIINILILNQSWTFNDLRGSQRTSNEEYHDFLRTLFRAPASR